MDTALRGEAVMEVSLVWCEEEKGPPSSHHRETSTFPINSIGYRFMRMCKSGGARAADTAPRTVVTR
jgi:hypothetical protein